MRPGVKPTEPAVACGEDAPGVWSKYLLGPAEVEGRDVDDAKGALDQQRGMWIVTMDFTDAGSKKFQAITSKLSAQADPQNRFAIVLDGEVVSAPSVRQTLSASAEISGNFNQQSAQDLGNILSYGALPLTFETQSVDTVTAALGGDQLEAGLIAGCHRSRTGHHLPGRVLPRPVADRHPQPRRLRAPHLRDHGPARPGHRLRAEPA